MSSLRSLAHWCANTPASLLALSEAKHNTSVKLAVLYYEERVLGINRRPEEIKALKTRIIAWVNVCFEDWFKYARDDRNNPNK